MDGIYRKNNNLHFREIIRRWMSNNITSKSYLLHDDIHIDEIDFSFEPSSSWLKGAIKCLEMAVEVRNKEYPSFLVALAFSLESKETPIGINFQNLGDLEKEFDVTPPSLYIFQKGSEPWVTNKNVFLHVDMDLFNLSKKGIAYFYAETLISNDEEYRRSLWIVG